MKTLTSAWLNKQAQRFSDSVSHFEFTVDGDIQTREIYRNSVEGDTVRLYIFLNETVAGRITDMQLIDKDGDVVAEINQSLIKPQDKGLYMVLRYQFREMEVESIVG